MARSECVYPINYELSICNSCAPFQEDGSVCSIFAFDVTADRSRLPLARNSVRKMRTLRHPGVIKVYDTVEVPMLSKRRVVRAESDAYDRQRLTSMLLRRESIL